jgi:hypothetical protein
MFSNDFVASFFRLKYEANFIIHARWHIQLENKPQRMTVVLIKHCDSLFLR